ncbi:MAG: hydrogenase formation protein HypD [Candidatus Omnitrophota bacterium]
MKYIDDFRSPRLIRTIAEKISRIMPQKEVKIMEVCGTHTQSFRRFGLGRLLPENLKFISGPGCPVCVSHQGFIDSAIALAKKQGVIIATFGDMLKVPGTRSSLEKERAGGAHIQLVYSPLDALKIARHNKDKKVVFLGVGFETTAPAVALSIKATRRENLKKLSFLCALKLMPPAMEYLLSDNRTDISGFLCPGHVSTIIGTRPYEFIPKQYRIPCCVSGFEPLDILEGIYLILEQINKNKALVANQYLRAVKKEGNPKARKIMYEVFRPIDVQWRGLGKIPGSGLKIKDEFSQWDSEKVFSIKPTTNDQRPTTKCRCVDVLKGLISPDECPLFRKICTPKNALGACMVSIEGACNAYYKYR